MYSFKRTKLYSTSEGTWPASWRGFSTTVLLANDLSQRNPPATWHRLPAAMARWLQDTHPDPKNEDGTVLTTQFIYFYYIKVCEFHCNSKKKCLESHVDGTLTLSSLLKKPMFWISTVLEKTWQISKQEKSLGIFRNVSGVKLVICATSVEGFPTKRPFGIFRSGFLVAATCADYIDVWLKTWWMESIQLFGNQPCFGFCAETQISATLDNLTTHKHPWPSWPASIDATNLHVHRHAGVNRWRLGCKKKMDNPPNHQSRTAPGPLWQETSETSESWKMHQMKMESPIPFQNL